LELYAYLNLPLAEVLFRFSIEGAMLQGALAHQHQLVRKRTLHDHCISKMELALALELQTFTNPA